MLLIPSYRTSSIIAEKIKMVDLLHVANNQFSDKLNNGKQKSKWPIYCDFNEHFPQIKIETSVIHIFDVVLTAFLVLF